MIVGLSILYTAQATGDNSIALGEQGTYGEREGMHGARDRREAMERVEEVYVWW